MRILVLIFLLASSIAEATHLRCGYITVRRLAPASYACEIKLTIYLNTDSEIEFGGGLLDFGDDHSLETPTVSSIMRPDLGPNVGEVTFTTMHTYAAGGTYMVNYTEPNREPGIVNMFNSVETKFYIETLVNLNAQYAPAITLVAPPVFRTTLGGPFSVGLGVTDEAGSRFQYFLTTPKKGRNENVDAYVLPAGIELNPYNGQFSWPLVGSPGLVVGGYVFAVRVDIYDESEMYIGSVTYDFEVIVEDGDVGGGISDNKDLDLTSRVYTDNTYALKVVFEGETTEWNMSLHADLSPSAVSMTTTDSTANGKFYKVNWITFNNQLAIQRTNPYTVVVRSSLNGLGSNTKDLTYLFFTEDVAFTDLILAVEKTGSREVRLYPNPVSRYLYFSGEADVRITIYRMNGQEVLSVKATPGQPLDLGDLPRGYYVARVNGAVFRLVKD